MPHHAPITVESVAHVHAFLRAHGENPDVMNPHFFLWHLERGADAVAVLKIATGDQYPCCGDLSCGCQQRGR